MNTIQKFGRRALLAWLLCASAATGQVKSPPAKGIDAATVAAYEKLGALYGGWVDNDGFP
jgi:hypothetical protein